MTPIEVAALIVLILFIIGTRVTGIVAKRQALKGGERVRALYTGFREEDA